MLELLLSFLLLVISLLALSYSSKIVLESAEKLASYFGFSKLAIGFILISLLTSLPELSIAIFSSATHNNNISLGDLLGSNVTNIALIFGIFLYFSAKEVKLNRDKINQILLYIFISITPILFFIDSSLTFSEGLVLILFYLFFLKLLLDSNERISIDNNVGKKEAAKQFLILLASIFVVLISSEFAVGNAVQIANELNLFQSFLGGTIIALSTSLPELAITISAIRKRATDIALGNLIGSNVVNITLLLGLNIVINPFIPNIEIATAIFSFIFISSGYVVFKLLTTNKLVKKDGLVLFLVYIVYIILMSYVQIGLA
jgi:cation:H+ antiporter